KTKKKRKRRAPKHAGTNPGARANEATWAARPRRKAGGDAAQHPRSDQPYLVPRTPHPIRAIADDGDQRDDRQGTHRMHSGLASDSYRSAALTFVVRTATDRRKRRG